MCCGSEKEEDGCGCLSHATIGEKDKRRPLKSSTSDLEKASYQEHVVTLVDGMTCSGCGNKFKRSLDAIAGVSSVQVNFVMGQAEFDVDTSVNSAACVLMDVERATDFRCRRVATDDRTLDVLASGGSARILASMAGRHVLGLNSATVLGKKTVRLGYDPRVIGARALLESLGHATRGLAPPTGDPSVSSNRQRLYDQLFKSILCATFTVPVLVLAWGDVRFHPRLRAILSLALATIVQLAAIQDFYRPAISALFHSRSIEMDMLVVISITAAYVYSVVLFGFHMGGKALQSPTLFETSTLLITLVLLGRLIAAFSRTRAVEAVSLRSLQATTAVILKDGRDKEMDARLLQHGDVLSIGPHSTVPTDGRVFYGSSEVDESLLTGEGVPVPKGKGDAVIAGTINGNGLLLAELTRLPGQNTVTDIAKLVEEAQKAKPKLQDQADRVASWFVPIVTSAAVIVIVVWLVIGFKLRSEPTGKSIATAISYAVATLAVSCPCALGLAVPMVLVIGGGIAARRGVIIKSGRCVERARKVTDVVLDKTGTVTEGNLEVVTHEYFGDERQAAAISKALVASNKHPVSLATARFVLQRDDPAPELAEVHVIPGAGVVAKLDQWTVRAGNPEWTETDFHPTIRRLQRRNLTILAVTRDKELMAVFGLRTSLREEAVRVVDLLKNHNIAVHLVSGDQKGAVAMVASRLGISHSVAQSTPAEKRDYVARLMSLGKCVMFVGDGTNDAVAVSQADIGVQVSSTGSASDVTRAAADVVLLSGLEGILFLMEMSRMSFRRIVFNFAWSAAYNVLAILLASGALVRVRIPPAYAGLGEAFSVVPVVVAAMTMLWNRPPRQPILSAA